MKKHLQKVLLSTAIAALINMNYSFAQLSDQEYVAVTMDLQGILQLNMTTEPQVDFVFNTIQKYQVGITKYNATRLEKGIEELERGGDTEKRVAARLRRLSQAGDWKEVSSFLAMVTHE